MRYVFFFSSRRRHTRWTGDWSSDVCSSDLVAASDQLAARHAEEGADDLAVAHPLVAADRFTVRERSEERRVGKGVDLGGRRIIKNKSNNMTESDCARRAAGTTLRASTYPG